MAKVFEVQKECRSYRESSNGNIKCDALTDMMCTYKDCPFYKTEEEYQEQLRRIRVNRNLV